MDTACLRIKFTPLLQNIKKEDRKHYFEIIPEIRCMQNLDKIQWIKDENSIEYTIPMTYKIILRKRDVTKDKTEMVNALDKTYHSCVDLLLPSSDIDVANLGSGDISKIVSDTFVLSKITSDIEKFSTVLKENYYNNDDKRSNSNKLTTAEVQTNFRSNPSIASQLAAAAFISIIPSKKHENALTQTSFEVLQSKSVVQVPESDRFDNKDRFLDQITNTESPTNLEHISGLKMSAAETVAHVKTSNNSKPDAKRKLRLTPVYSIRTEDDSTGSANTILSNTIIFHVFESNKSCVNNDIVEKYVENNDFTYETCKNNQGNKRKAYDQFDSISSQRILPEIRVANFVQIMEKEIMPLKRLLCDIISKCSLLGFKCKNLHCNTIIYKNMPNPEKQISNCKTIEKSKSNRVVYSIVFDE